MISGTLRLNLGEIQALLDKLDSPAAETPSTLEKPNEETGLAPCPFCGSTCKPRSIGNIWKSHAMCEGCHAQGPVARFEHNEHFKAWNQRAQPVSAYEPKSTQPVFHSKKVLTKLRQLKAQLTRTGKT